MRDNLKRQIAASEIGRIAERAVIDELCKSGWDVFLPDRADSGIDIIAYEPNGKKLLRIQVKSWGMSTTERNVWLRGSGRDHCDLFVVVQMEGKSVVGIIKCLDVLEEKKWRTMRTRLSWTKINRLPSLKLYLSLRTVQAPMNGNEPDVELLDLFGIGLLKELP